MKKKLYNLGFLLCFIILFCQSLFAGARREDMKINQMEEKDMGVDLEFNTNPVHNQAKETSTFSENLFADKLNSYMPLDKNYMFSPLSIKIALAMAANGAEGETKEQILKALDIENIEDFNNTCKKMIENLPYSDIQKLNIANSLWINKSRTNNNFSQSFTQLLTQFFKAEAQTVDNSNAVAIINNWVSKNTNDKIKAIINDSNFEALLVNAIYFKGAWQKEFNEMATKPEIFYNADGTETTTDFMNQTGYFSYTSTDKTQIIELPYKRNPSSDDFETSMYILLPNQGVELSVLQDLEDAISTEKLNRTFVRFSMPKFKIEYSTLLNKTLESIGITRAFSNQAQLEPMFQSNQQIPSFSQVLHKTYITVDEKGTEAAAVTAIGLATSSLPPKPITLTLDKPFYFVIRDNNSGETLFIGRHAFAEKMN